MHTDHAAYEKTVSYPANLAGQSSDDLSHLQELFGTKDARRKRCVVMTNKRARRKRGMNPAAEYNYTMTTYALLLRKCSKLHTAFAPPLERVGRRWQPSDPHGAGIGFNRALTVRAVSSLPGSKVNLGLASATPFLEHS